jgi:hypothetical protein
MTDLDPGIYGATPAGDWQRVADDDGGDWTLADLPELFGLGTLAQEDDDRLILALEPRAARQLKPLADAQSFDHEEGLIAAMHAMAAFAHNHPDPELRFLQVF